MILTRYKLLNDREISRRPFMSFVLEHLLQIWILPSEVLMISSWKYHLKKTVLSVSFCFQANSLYSFFIG